MSRKSMTGAIVKSIVFIVVTTMATVLLAISIANTGIGNTASYSAKFTDATGLNVGDSVRIAGVRVGQVKSVKVVDRRLAKVTFSLQSGRTLPASVTAAVKYLNLVGQRYLELDQGTGPVGATLPRGATIPLERTTPPLNLTQLFNGFQPLFQALSPKEVNQLAGEIIQVLQGETSTIDSLIANIATLTTSLANKDEVIGRVIDNLTEVVDTVNARQGEFTDLITTLRQFVHGFAQDRKPIGQAIEAISNLTQTSAGYFGGVRDPLRADIRNLGRLSANLNRDEPLVDSFLERLPTKLRTIGRLPSYGSWINLYLCQASITGLQFDTSDPRTGKPPPVGIPVMRARCKS